MGQFKIFLKTTPEDQIHILTTKPYFELFRKNPFVHNVILDKRKSRFNLIYLYMLMRNLKEEILEKFMIYKTLLEQNFIKIFYFQKQILILGLAQKQLCQAIFQKMNLIKTQF